MASEIIVIGGGASGMAAALTAARERENRVVLLERQARTGRKLMSTGNGRCNLTNTMADVSHYHGEDPSFVAPALAALPPAAAIELFRSLGLFTVTEYGGRVYPLSNSANSVCDTLRYSLEAAGVELMPDRPALSIRKSGAGFLVATDKGELAADAVIVACGGLAGEKLGGVKDGYELLCSLGHSRTALRPSLVQITTDPAYPRALKGVKADCRAGVYSGGEKLSESEGEMLFTETGVSGPAAFDLSRTVSTAGDRKLALIIDLLREYSQDEAAAALTARALAMPRLPASDILTGVLHNRLGRMLVKYAALPADRPLAELSAEDIKTIARACKRFALDIRGVEGFASAQVTAGGVKTSEFDPATMMSRLVPNLYACGEVLDIDGDCGGYNLQWAWASGVHAGRLLK